MNIFRIIASLITLYSLICFVRVMLTWFPGAEYSQFGRLLSRICDPYLNIFRKLSFLRFSAFDFSPAVALCVLIALSTLCASFANGINMSIGMILAGLVTMLWSIVQSILLFMIIILIVRLIVYFIKGDRFDYGSIWNAVDRAITPLMYRICSIFTGRRTLSFKNALIISTLILVAFSIIGKVLIQLLCALLYML